MLAKLEILALIIFFGFAISVTQPLHSDYPMPLHSDGWDHIAIAKQISSESKIIEKDPYTGLETMTMGRSDPQIAYHVWLATILNVTGFQGIELSLVVPAIVAFLMCFFTYLLVLRLTNNRLPAILASIFVLFLRTNVTTLGFQFLVPLALGMAFLPMLIYCFLRALDSKRFAVIFAILFASLTLFYPVTTIILLPVFGIYLLFRPKSLRKNLKLVLAAFVLLPALALPFAYYAKADSLALGDLIGKILSRMVWNPLNSWKPLFYLDDFLGVPVFALSILGIFSILLLELFGKTGRAKRAVSKYYPNGQLLILPLFVIVLFPLLLHHHIFSFTYLAPYLRMFMFVESAMLMLAGIGLGMLAVIFLEAASKLPRNRAAVRQALLAGVIFAFVCYGLLTFPFFAADKADFYRNIEQSNLPSIAWLKENTAESDVVISVPWQAKAFSLLTQRAVVGTTPARVQYLGAQREKFFDSMYFFVMPCGVKRELVNEYGFGYVYSQTKLECDFLDKIFSDGENSVYKVNV